MNIDKKLKSISELDTFLQQAMINLTINAPLLAMTAAKVGINTIEDNTQDYLAWTNGHGIFFNRACILDHITLDKIVMPNNKVMDFSLTKDNLVFLIAHEVGHIICRHFERAKNIGLSLQSTSIEDARKFELWNIAADHEINLILKYNKTKNIVASIGKILDTALCDDKYIDMPAEKIYQMLLEEEKNNPNNSNKFVQTLTDNHTGKEIEVAASSWLQEVDEITQDRFKQIVSEIFGNREQGSDNTNAFKRLFNLGQIVKPFNWRNALAKYIKSWIKSNYTWNVPSRAGLASGLILPSTSKAPKLHLAVAIDTSCSISNKELNAMLQHLFIILNQFKDFTIDVWCCGTQVFEETFTTFTNKNKHKLKNYKIVSNGCNDMEKNFAFIEKKYTNNKPDVFICMSDFYDKLNGNNEVRYNGDCIFMVIDHPDFIPPKNIKAKIIPFEIPGGK